MPVCRRKYRYASRRAAEDAASELQRFAALNSVALNAVLNGRVQWLKGKWGEKGKAFYRFGLIPRISGCLVIVQFCCPQTGQQDHATVYDADEWVNEEIKRFAFPTPDLLQCGYRAGLYELRRAVNEASKTL